MVVSNTEYCVTCVWIAEQCKFITRGPVADSAAIVHNGTVDVVAPKGAIR